MQMLRLDPAAKVLDHHRNLSRLLFRDDPYPRIG